MKLLRDYSKPSIKDQILPTRNQNQSVNSTLFMASQSSFSYLKMDRFSRLPADLRLKIFAYTDLVARDRDGRKTEVHVYDGEISDPPAHSIYMHDEFNCSCPVKFPVELLDTRNPFYTEVLEVFFSQNRIVFAESFVKTRAFLQAHRQGLNHIHKLDFQFDQDVIEEWTETDTLSLE